MSMTQAASQYFEQVAGEWDSIRSGYFTEAVREAAITKAYLRPEMVVADVGAGTGFMAAGLVPLVQKVIVLDGSDKMLDVARKNLAAFEDKLEYHRADGQSLPLPDASVDAAFANMYLHHCPDPLAAIREMVRILKPGGRLVITDMDSHPYQWLKEELADEWMGFERDQVRSWFNEADLVNTIVDCSGQSCCAESQNTALSDEQGRTAHISIFLATGTRRVRMQSAVQQAYSAAALSQDGCACGTGASSSGCCGSNEDLTQNIILTDFYSPQEKASVPNEAGEFSLGCGNPLAMANLRPGEVVLDIGSGGGLDAFLAASRVGPGGQVIGVDMTPAMLERATQTASKSGIHNVEFRQGQAEALPVLDGAVDVVISNCVINLCENKGKVFQEAYRVLKIGGRLEVSDIVSGGPLAMGARQNAAEWAGCVAGALPETEYLDLITQAGFKLTTTRRSTPTNELSGAPIFSLIVSAHKEDPLSTAPTSSCACN